MRDKIRILFLSANPIDKGMLQLGEEVRAFVERMEPSRTRDTFELITTHAIRTSDLQVALLRYRPHVVHFSGHQSFSADISLREDPGKSKHISEQALAELFKGVKDTVRVVFFDACFTKSQAQAISRVIDFTVGTSKAVDDRAAINFATNFYQALFFDRSIGDAFELAKAELDLAGSHQANTPELLIRKGVDKGEPFQSLTEDADERAAERLKTALVHLVSGKGTKAEANLIRDASIDGRVVIEKLEDVAGTIPLEGAESPDVEGPGITEDPRLAQEHDVLRTGIREDWRGGQPTKVPRRTKTDIWVIPSPETTRAGTREDIRVGVSESAYGRLQEQLYPSPPGLLPPRPSLPFIGRADALTEIKKLIGVGQPEVRSKLTVVRGWPGVGKTTIAGVLARDSEIAKKFPDGVLWTSLDRSPELMFEIARWSRFLGDEDLLRVPILDEATEKLATRLRSKKMLLIVDDIWNAADALPFLRAIEGNRCALLATTRLTGVAHELANTAGSPDENIYVLPVLTEDNALTLLRYLAPAVVESHFDACQELVRSLECLPLALQVAGRLLNDKSRRRMEVTDLLTAITKGAELLTETKPLDRAEGAVLPSVGALLRRSTDELDELTRERFAYLGAFAPKPATFDLDAVRAVWMVEDPKPIIRKLVYHGLLEPVGHGRFQMHALLAQHALSLLS